jgi:hypothetical protein
MAVTVGHQLDVMHVSMQFSDSTRQKQVDAERIFARASKRHLTWITGTEAGQGASGDLRDALREQATRSGYRLVLQADLWIAVRKTGIVKDSWSSGFIPVIKANEGSQKFSTRGIAWAQWKDADLGVLSVGVSHYMTHGRNPRDEYYAANGKLTRAIGEWGKIHGKGKKLAFYAADANASDRTDDVFRGQPFTTLADELKSHQDTGHGPIDYIASYNADTRVKGKYWRVLDDSEFPLNTDHFACEGGFLVRGL